jgi:D-glycero-D-manno-heptose 1,7-bisphosphate phosphatase
LSTPALPRQSRRAAVFLDRDGVLNQVTLRDGRPHPPPTAAELRLLPGVEAACRRLHDSGFALVVITNQPDIARGHQTWDEVDRMHDYLRSRLPLDEVVVCPHDDSDECLCRKPQPGMILDAAARLGLDLPASFCVGDRWRDVEAARRAGVRAIHIECHYAERPADGAHATVSGLPEAVDFIESHVKSKETYR